MQISHLYPMAGSSISAGFPGTTEADEYTQNLSFDDLLVRHQPSTFFVRVSGNSLIEAGIFEQDILVVDKQLEAKTGDLVVAVIENEFTAKFLSRTSAGLPVLLPANSKFSPITFELGRNLNIWGVVTGVVRQLKRNQVNNLVS